MVIGTIKEIEVIEDQILAIVSMGNGDEKPCITYGGAGFLGYPQVGDQCVIANVGNEFVIVAVFASGGNLETGETILFGRDADGVEVSRIKLSNDGSIKLSNDSGFIELKADGQANINDNLTVDV